MAEEEKKRKVARCMCGEEFSDDKSLDRHLDERPVHRLVEITLHPGRPPLVVKIVD